MIPSEKEKLYAFNKQCISIGITADGASRKAIAVPWERTSNAFNMRTPDIYLCEEDLYDEEIISELKKRRVIGCYAFCGLKSYSVLSLFTELQDLYLRDAVNLTDFSFMERMSDWFMLFVEGACADNLDAPFSAIGKQKSVHCYCLGFCNCQIGDISALINSSLYISELLIWNKWDQNEHDRWKRVRAACYRYFKQD